MSNFRALATVTATIAQILANVDKDVPGTRITMKPPDIAGKTETNSLNLFLYQIEPNVAYRNIDVSTRKDGELAQPHLALNLHYLLTAYATNGDELQAQQILASAMSMLNDNPFLARESIRKAIQSEPKIKGSDLTDQVEMVKITLQPLSLEEITKLWASFFQTDYHISVAYEANVVLLNCQQEPKSTLPVRKPAMGVDLLQQPIIERIEPQIVERTKNAKIEILGHNLKNNRVQVQFGGLDPITPGKEDVSSNQITIAVPENLPAGVKSVQVLKPFTIGEPSGEHRGYKSNVAAFVLAPKITNTDPIEVSRGADLKLEFEPAVTPQQKAEILIGDYTITVPSWDHNSNPQKQFSVRIAQNFPVGDYLLRLRVQNVDSLLVVEDGQFVGPKVRVK